MAGGDIAGRAALLLFALLGSILYCGTALLYASIQRSTSSCCPSGFHMNPRHSLRQLMTVGLFAKTALFPLHLWLPRPSGAPAAASAVLSAVVVKGSYFLVVRLVRRHAGCSVSRRRNSSVRLGRGNWFAASSTATAAPEAPYRLFDRCTDRLPVPEFPLASTRVAQLQRRPLPAACFSNIARDAKAAMFMGCRLIMRHLDMIVSPSLEGSTGDSDDGLRVSRSWRVLIGLRQVAASGEMAVARGDGRTGQCVAMVMPRRPLHQRYMFIVLSRGSCGAEPLKLRIIVRGIRSGALALALMSLLLAWSPRPHRCGLSVPPEA